MRSLAAPLLGLTTVLLLTGCAAAAFPEGDDRGSASATHSPSPSPRGAAAASVDLGDLDDDDDDNDDDGNDDDGNDGNDDDDNDDDDNDDDDNDPDDEDHLDVGHLDLDPDDLDDMSPEERDAHLGAIVDSIRNPGPDAAVACISVDLSAISALESRLRGVSVEDASSHLSDDGEHFFVVVLLEGSSKAVFATEDNPAVAPFAGEIVAVDDAAKQLSDWPPAEEAGFDVSDDDSGGTKLLNCVG